jgi:hypothetical protein
MKPFLTHRTLPFDLSLEVNTSRDEYGNDSEDRNQDQNKEHLLCNTAAQHAPQLTPSTHFLTEDLWSAPTYFAA